MLLVPVLRVGTATVDEGDSKIIVWFEENDLVVLLTLTATGTTVNVVALEAA